MMDKQEHKARGYEAAPEAEQLAERSSAPTLRDLRAAAKDLLAMIAAESEPTSSNDGRPHPAA